MKRIITNLFPKIFQNVFFSLMNYYINITYEYIWKSANTISLLFINVIY